MKFKKLLSVAILLASALGANAQTDVTDTYLTNAGFDETADFQTGNIGNTNQYEASGWIIKKQSSDWTYGGVIGFGGTGTINGSPIPTTNSTGEQSGGALCISGAWAGGNGYISYSQETKANLPAGKYNIEIPVNNVGKDQNMSTSFFDFTTANGDVYAANKFSFPASTWTENVIDFSLPTASKGTIRLGFQWKDTGSGNTPKLVIDYVKILYVGNYTETLKSAIDRANILYTRTNDSDLQTAINNAQIVLNNVDNTEAYQATINQEVETLRAAINTAAGKVILLEGENIGFMFENIDFESSTPVSVGSTTYDYDAAKNGTSFSRMQVVEGWTIAENGNARAAGAYSYGGTAFLGSTTRFAPPAPYTVGEKNALGFVGVWSAKVQYKQSVTLPAGSYVLNIPVYNASGTTAFNKNLIGFIEDGEKEHLASNKTYTVGAWTLETIAFTLEKETSGYLSLGYTSANNGSGAMPHLFVDNISIQYTSPIAAAKTALEVVVNEANSVKESKMSASVLSDLTNALNNAKYVLDNSKDLDEHATAQTELENAIDAAKNSVSVYVTLDKAIKIIEGCSETDVAEAIRTKYNNGEYSDETTTADIFGEYQTGEIEALLSSSAKELTSAIINPSFETGDMTGWSAESRNDVGVKEQSNGTYSVLKGARIDGNYLFNSWGGSAENNVYQTIKNLPAGTYTLSAVLAGFNDEVLELYANEVEGNVTVTADKTVGNLVSLTFTLSETSDVVIKACNTKKNDGASDASFVKADNFRLMVGDILTDDYTDLNSEINNHTLGFDKDEYAPYNNAAAINALAIAKDVNQEISMPELILDEIINDLTSAEWTVNVADVDAIYNGNFAEVTEGANYPNGWERTNSWGQMIDDASGSDNGTAYYNQPGSLVYGNTGIFTMPLNAETYYRLTFKYRSHENGSNTGVTVSVLNGEEGLSATEFEENASTSEWATAEAVFETGAAGNYVLTLNNHGNTWMTDVTLVKCEETAANMTITEAGWATFIAPFEVEIPAGVTAYTVEGVKADNYLNKAALETVIPANTPVLLEGAAMTETFYGQNTATQDTYGDVLVGNVSGVTKNVPNNGESFVLLKQDDNLGFYKVASDDITVGNNRCYLNVPAGGEIKAFFFDDDATGINGIADDATVVERYNAAGMKVAAPVKGLNIVKLSNGKTQKVLVK